jgi:hypothetical protein
MLQETIDNGKLASVFFFLLLTFSIVLRLVHDAIAREVNKLP